MTRRGIVRVIILLFILIIIGGAIAYFFGFGRGPGPGSGPGPIDNSNNRLTVELNSADNADSIMQKITSWRSANTSEKIEIVIRVSLDAQAKEKAELEKKIEAAGLAECCRYELTN